MPRRAPARESAKAQRTMAQDDRQLGPPSSRILLTRVRAGDDDAYREMFARYTERLEKRMVSALGPKLRRRLGVDDLLQDVWTQFSRNAGRLEYRGGGSLYRWLCRVADNVVRMAQRAHVVSDCRAVAREDTFQPAPGSSGFEARLPASIDPSPSAAASNTERLEALSRLLGRLSDDHRGVIRLVYVERRSVADAAQVLERSPNAVKKLLGRAMARCAELAASDSFAAYRSDVELRG